MSKGAQPEGQASCSSLSQHFKEDLKVQNSSSELYELKPKPKLFCIPKKYSNLLSDLRRTQSLNVPKKNEQPEKSWSVLYVATRSCKGKDSLQ